MRATLPANETERLAALREYAILDSLPEQVYDDITYIASRICAVPIALVSLVDAERQWFKSKVGLDATETPRDWAFCAHAILEPTELFVVADAKEDARFATSPLVTSEPHIRFYAGAPLVTTNGAGLGTLCVIDRVPRELTAEQQQSLRALSRQVMALLGLRKALAEISQHALEREQHQMQLEAYQKELEAANTRLAAQSLTDDLTGLRNRRAFNQALETEVYRAQRYATSLSLALIDIDHFKSYNDSFGHPEGDEVLKRVARVLGETGRTSDIVARIGGEEFAVILPGASAANAYILAQRFRQAIERAQWTRRQITVSVGIATCSSDIDSSAAFVRLADDALYASKESGRNRVTQAATLPR